MNANALFAPLMSERTLDKVQVFGADYMEPLIAITGVEPVQRMVEESNRVAAKLLARPGASAAEYQGEAPLDVIGMLAVDQAPLASSPVAVDESQPVVTPQDTVRMEQPRQVQSTDLGLQRWMTGTADAGEAAGQDDLESLIDSLVDDVAEQWNG